MIKLLSDHQRQLNHCHCRHKSTGIAAAILPFWRPSSSYGKLDDSNQLELQSGCHGPLTELGAVIARPLHIEFQQLTPHDAVSQCWNFSMSLSLLQPLCQWMHDKSVAICLKWGMIIDCVQPVIRNSLVSASHTDNEKPQGKLSMTCKPSFCLTAHAALWLPWLSNCQSQSHRT